MFLKSKAFPSVLAISEEVDTIKTQLKVLGGRVREVRGKGR